MSRLFDEVRAELVRDHFELFDLFFDLFEDKINIFGFFAVSKLPLNYKLLIAFSNCFMMNLKLQKCCTKTLSLLSLPVFTRTPNIITALKKFMAKHF